MILHPAPPCVSVSELHADMTFLREDAESKKKPLSQSETARYSSPDTYTHVRTYTHTHTVQKCFFRLEGLYGAFFH